MIGNKWIRIAAAWTAGVFSVPACAGTFNWGDISDPAGEVMYLNVEETNAYATSLFAPEPGTGSPTASGNAIRFDPQGFQASANGGSQTTTSTVTMLLMAQPGKVIENLLVSELGDYTLSGLAGGVASVEVGADFSWTILEVDGSPVSLPTQMDSLQVNGGAGPNGGLLTRPGDDGTALPWDGTVLLDFDAYLANAAISGSATKVEVAFTNNLSATADAVSNAFIKKKEIGGFAVTANIPEPTTLALLVAAVSGLLSSRRR
ncbi:MAG: PEP-CTERM sorting domain-containing protein [Planctomycetota bacterium]